MSAVEAALRARLIAHAERRRPVVDVVLEEWHRPVELVTAPAESSAADPELLPTDRSDAALLDEVAACERRIAALQARQVELLAEFGRRRAGASGTSRARRRWGTGRTSRSRRSPRCSAGRPGPPATGWPRRTG